MDAALCGAGRVLFFGAGLGDGMFTGAWPDVTLDVLNGATRAPDSTVVANKLNVAAYFSAKVEAGCDYGGEPTGVASLSGVTDVYATVIAAKAGIDSRCRF